MIQTITVYQTTLYQTTGMAYLGILIKPVYQITTSQATRMASYLGGIIMGILQTKITYHITTSHTTGLV